MHHKMNKMGQFPGFHTGVRIGPPRRPKKKGFLEFFSGRRMKVLAPVFWSGRFIYYSKDIFFNQNLMTWLKLHC